MKKLTLFAFALLMAVSAQAVDLSTLTAAYTIQDGEVATGTKAITHDWMPISIAADATITLNNVTIQGRDHDPNAGLTCLGNAIIIIQGVNQIRTALCQMPAIFIPEGYTLTIRLDDDETPGTLIASNSGTAPGIGGGHNEACGNIRIEGGTIIATGGIGCPGIGGAWGRTCGTITVTDDVTSLTAIKGDDAEYSIGASNASCGAITIGENTYHSGITTSPYTYTPAPWDGDLSKVRRHKTIRENMTLHGTMNLNTQHYRIKIINNVTVTLDNVSIKGNSNASYAWAGLNCEGNITLVLKGANIIRGSSDDYPGIYIKKNYLLTIREHTDGGSLTAYSDNAAGIGGGKRLDCGDIRIEGGTIKTTGTATNAAGIGGGHNASCGHITIAKGTIVARGGSYAPAIGSGRGGSCGVITIGPESTVTATKGNNSPCAIGHGDSGTCEGIYIDRIDVGDCISQSPFVYPQECKTPTNVHVVGQPEQYSVTLQWTPGNSDQTAWWIGFKTATDDDYTPAVVDVNPYTIGSLTPETEYQFAVMAYCGGLYEEFSEWSEPIKVTTAACRLVSDLEVKAVTSSTAVVAWQSGNDNDGSWCIYWRNTATGVEMNKCEYELTTTLYDLEPNTQYEIWVGNFCGASESVFLTTAPEGIDEIRAAGKAAKTLRDGQLVIIKGDKTFDVLGAEVR